MEARGVEGHDRGWGVLAGFLACLVLFSASNKAQTQVDPAKARMQEMDRRELLLNSPGGNNGRPNDPKRSQALMDQVNVDFRRILTRHNEIVRAIYASQSFNYQFIAEATAEIRKRSTRLQSSLKLEKLAPASDDRKTESLVVGMETRDEMILLCKKIESFVKNPIIEKPGTVDAEALAQARKDLQSIVELSDFMKKQADKRTH